MTKFNEFYISSSRIFWTINFTFSILVVLIIGFLFDFEIGEILIQMLIGIIMTFVLIWILGGYNKIKSKYLERQNGKQSF